MKKIDVRLVLSAGSGIGYHCDTCKGMWIDDPTQVAVAIATQTAKEKQRYYYARSGGGAPY